MHRKQKRLDRVLLGFTITMSAGAISFLAIIVFYVFSNGLPLFSLETIMSDFHGKHYNASIIEDSPCDCSLHDVTLDDETYYSERFGLGIKNATDRAGNRVIQVEYIHPNSPLRILEDRNNETRTIALDVGMTLQRISYEDHPTSLTRFGAEAMVDTLNSDAVIREISFASLGGGFRGSLITTLYVIGLTLLIAVPFGIVSAIYLNEFAPKNTITRFIRSAIETLTGVPSIIYGLIGLSLFVPITVRLQLSSGANLYAAALTLAIILLPVIIRTTEESLKAIPKEVRDASFALGADQSQTVWYLIVPNALAGILTAVFLSIGRIIGESAALIFILGTAIKDSVHLSERSPTLAVHIWSLMSNEPANIELASTIALVILMVVLLLNLFVKWLHHRLHKRIGGSL